MKVAPSILASDFARLGQEVADVDAAGADWIHLDVMDGHFVPNLTIGPGVIAALRSYTDKFFDAHLMVSPVDEHLAAFAKAGVDQLTVHAEAGPHLQRTLAAIRDLGVKAGVALNPSTPIEAVEWVLDDVDLILVMSVNPGFGGQKFLPNSVARVARTRALVGDRPIEIQVDGGVDATNSRLLADAGATVVVAGSAVFKGGTPESYAANIAAIRQGSSS